MTPQFLPITDITPTPPRIWCYKVERERYVAVCDTICSGCDEYRKHYEGESDGNTASV